MTIHTLPVSVIVPHYNDLEGLDRCLTALCAQTMPKDAFEIIVSDNASPCGEAAVAAIVGDRARLVTCTERGAGPARNHAATHARGAAFAFTDADCVPEPGWLAAGREALEQTDIVGGQMTVIVGAGARLSGAEAFEAVFAFNNERYVKERGFSVTANLFCRQETFRAVGGFRNGVSEDLDWCQRATGKGFDLRYAKGAVVGHPARPDWAALQKKWQRLMAEEFGLVPTGPAGTAKWLLKAWALPASAAVHAPKVLTSVSLSRPGDRLSALGTLFRLRLWRTAEAHRLLFRRWRSHGSARAGAAAS